MTFAYSVLADFDDPAVAEEWVHWLVDGHLDDVVKAGAQAAELVRWGPLRLESRYRFESPEAFATYERDHAPKLRAEGLQKFPPSRGIRMTRSTGEILAVRPSVAG